MNGALPVIGPSPAAGQSWTGALPPQCDGAVDDQSGAGRLAEVLIDSVRSLPGAIVAFSGGVDSAVVCAAAVRALGAQACLAVTAVNPALASGEREEAEELAWRIGIRHLLIQTGEGGDPRYIRNSGDRCYWCKSSLYTSIRAAVTEPWPILNGTNFDDLSDVRPGLRAAGEAGVLSPLAALGIGKQQVRTIARHWNLPVWDKPAMPCLASRIAQGVPVTPGHLAMIDRTEGVLRQAGFRICRVRLHAGPLARIEVDRDRVGELVAWLAMPGNSDLFHAAGFRFVTVDVAGFRSGSLNVLPAGPSASPLPCRRTDP